MDYRRFDALSFDCYGTLVDWEAGILAALRPVLQDRGLQVPDQRILKLYGGLEAEAEGGGWVSYRTVLRRVVDGFGRELGFRPTREERDCLAESLGDWPLFPDTKRALERLAGTFRLAVVSNVDDDLFAATREHLGVDFEAVVTAEQIRSYKPAPAHFQALMERLGLDRDRILHAAQSLHHDIGPAMRLGITTVWVNRRQGRAGPGATPPASAEPDLEVPDLATLAEQVTLEG